MDFDRPIAVLVVEDDLADFRIIERHLETVRAPVYRLERASNADEASKALASGEFDVALVDFRLSSGVDGLQFVNKMGGREASLPFILLTGMEGGELDKRAILAGAYDYIDKMALTRELIDRAIRFAVSSFRYERDLRNAVKIAQEQAALNRQILSIVGHELRSPLSSIVAYADYIIDTCQTGTTRDAAERMRRGCQHLQDFLTNLSEFVRLDEGAAEIIRDDFNMATLLQETLDIFRPHAQHKLISLVTDYDRSIHETFVGDRLRIRQVLINIIKNAVTYTDEGTITISARMLDGLMEIKIVDDGVGIPSTKVKALLSVETWQPRPGRSLESGLGIGLAISIRLLRLMNGWLEIESTEGFGTTVVVNIPLESRSAAA